MSRHTQQINAEVDAETRRGPLGAELAVLLEQRGEHLGLLGKFAEANSDFDGAIHIYQTLGQDPKTHEFSGRHGRALVARGNSCLEQRQTDEANRCFQAAMDLFDLAVKFETVKNAAEPDARSSATLADTLSARGAALLDLDRLQDALADLTRAVDLQSRWLENPPSTDAANSLAESLRCRALVQLRLDQFPLAMRDYQRALELLAQRHETDSAPDTARQFGRTLNDRGTAISSMSVSYPDIDIDEAIADFDRSIELYDRLVETEGRSEYTAELASVLENRGVTRRAQARPNEACRDYDRAVEIFSTLLERDNRTDLAGEFAACLLNRSYALHEQFKDDGPSKIDEAIRDIERAVVLYHRHDPDPDRLAELRELRAELVDLRRHAND